MVQLTSFCVSDSGTLLPVQTNGSRSRGKAGLIYRLAILPCSSFKADPLESLQAGYLVQLLSTTTTTTPPAGMLAFQSAFLLVLLAFDCCTTTQGKCCCFPGASWHIKLAGSVDFSNVSMIETNLEFGGVFLPSHLLSPHPLSATMTELPRTGLN